MPEFQTKRRLLSRLGRPLAITLLAAAGAVDLPRCQNSPPDLTTLGIEAVMNMEVTSVSKKPEKFMDTTAAVYVITAEDIRRSGATSLPELLRLVPGVQVARINSNTWAVGVRGFTSSLSRSLLVLIDGRSVYSPLFAGVYWDVQDTLLEDIERIEVIRGPGATLWGANAVNGVINIITKSASQTQGTFASVGGGNEERLLAGARFGSETSHGVAFRTYAKFFDRDAEFHESTPDFDGWHMTQAGFRAGGERGGKEYLTLQGDIYDGRSGQRATLSTYAPPFTQTVQEDADLWGANLLGQWKHQLHQGSDATLQFYYDRTHRRQSGFQEDRDTFDVEFRHQFRFASRHELLWGAGYRLTSGDTESVPTIQFIPEDRTDDVLNAFVQDDIRLVPSKWTLTIGSKFEHNDYSGFNYQPNVRLLFSPSSRHVFWSAVSRALRVPSRLEHDLALTALVDPATPTFVRVMGTKDFEPERLTAYEVGYRAQATQRLILDLATFYNEYTRLLSLEPGTPFSEATPPPSHTVVPFFIRNKIAADVYGAEIASEWRPLAPWRLTGSYSYLHMNLIKAADSLDPSTEAATEGSSPRHMAGLRSFLDLPQGLGLDVMLRYVGSLPSQQVAAYTEMDVHLTRHLTRRLELSLVGQNLLSPHHAEFAGGGGGPIEIQRSLYGRLVGRW